MRHRASARGIPPPLELQCLKALWQVGEGNVNDVREIVTEQRDLAYTTVMTVLDRLVRRGCAERRKVGRAFFYAPVSSQEQLRGRAVQELIDSFFGGSQRALLSYLQGEPLEKPAATPSTSTGDRLDTALL